MNLKAVIDTNVIVSAFLTKNKSSPTVRILNAIITHIFTPLYTSEIIDEYREVLQRLKFHFNANNIEDLLTCIVTYGEFIRPVDCDESFPDPDDKVFYCVVKAEIENDAKLVTGNQRHYPPVTFVVTPAEFCALMGI